MAYRLSEFCEFVDENSDPGVPLTFLTADVEHGVPRYEEAPYHILPGELFVYDFRMGESFIKSYFALILKHDYDYGVEITKEVLLDEILYPQLEKYARRKFFIDVYDENNEYFLQMLAISDCWSFMECPERNVFYCHGNIWEETDLEMLTGGESCAMSLAY